MARQFDLKPSEVKSWVVEGLSNMENGFRSRPRDIEAQYEIKLAEAYVALAQLEIKALKIWKVWLGRVSPSLVLRGDNGLVFTSKEL